MQQSYNRLIVTLHAVAAWPRAPRELNSREPCSVVPAMVALQPGINQVVSNTCTIMGCAARICIQIAYVRDENKFKQASHGLKEQTLEK